jgi:hypothetical protein
MAATDEAQLIRRALKIGDKAATRAVKARLKTDLGTWRSARVLARVLWGKLRGAPFAALGKPTDQRDKLSRRQCGDVVLLYRAITAVSANEALALAICRDAVLSGGLPFLEAMIPPLPETGLGAFAKEIVGRFFNAEGETEANDAAKTFSLTVRRCRFVELLEAVGEAQLMPLFCAVDHAFFGEGHRPVRLERTQTLAGGGDRCDFRFSVAKPER